MTYPTYTIRVDSGADAQALVDALIGDKKNILYKPGVALSSSDLGSLVSDLYKQV